MSNLHKVSVAAMLLALGAPAMAQAPPATPAPASKPLSTSLGMVVFPAKGQAAQQQAQDEGECYAWSKGQTGVDPMAAPAPAQAAAPPAQTAKGADGSRLRGAARGAAAGAVAGGRQSRKNQQQAAEQANAQQQQATQQQHAAHQQQLDLFKKGFAACLEPKGYTIK